jgi:hypothetical protein
VEIPSSVSGFVDGATSFPSSVRGRSGSAATAAVCSTDARAGDGAWYNFGDRSVFGSGSPGGSGGFGGTVRNGANFLVASGGSSGRLLGGGGAGSGAAQLCGEGGTSEINMSGNVTSGGSYVPVGGSLGLEISTGASANGRVVIRY